MADLQIIATEDGLSDGRLLLGPGRWMVYISPQYVGAPPGAQLLVSHEDVDASYCTLVETVKILYELGFGLAYAQEISGNQWVAVNVIDLPEDGSVKLVARKVRD